MPFLRIVKQSIFEPPYRLLPAAVWIFFALCFSLNPNSPLQTWQLFDTDDYMRLNEVMNWLRSAHPFGAGWYDLSQPRLSPGEHVVVHWDRLVDLPLAFFAYPLIDSLGLQKAVMVAGFIVPPILFALLLFVVSRAARPLINKSADNLACLMVLFAPADVMNFMPGRVDHHAYQIIIAMIGIWALTQCVLSPKGWIAAIIATIAFACGLWIGTEALPWAILFVGGLAILGSWRGGFALRNAAVFGLAFPLCVAVIIPIAVLPEEYSSRALSWFSSADLIFALLAGGALIGGWALGRCTEKKLLRFALMGSLGFCAALFFPYFVPDLLMGAYADYNQFFNFTLVGNIGEARPLINGLIPHKYITASYTAAFILFSQSVLLPLISCGVVIWNMVRGPRRDLWFIHAIFLIPALLMTVFWQTRVSWFAEIFAVVPQTWLLIQIWKKIAARFGGYGKYCADTFSFIAITPTLWVTLIAITITIFNILFPSPLHAAGSPKDALMSQLFFVGARGKSACPLIQTSAFLNSTYGDKTRLILSGVNEGPELLYRTNHNVLSAPYNADGNADAFEFFNARDEQKAKEVVQRRHVDLILLCRNIAPFYMGLSTYKSRINADFTIDKSGKLHIHSSKDHPTIIERLGNGDIPKWLKPVNIPDEPNYILFEVD